MKQSATRNPGPIDKGAPEFAALHPGYLPLAQLIHLLFGVSLVLEACDSADMAQAVSIIIASEDRAHLAAVIEDRNGPRKHVQRVRIVLLSGDRLPGSGGGSTDRVRRELHLMQSLAGMA